MPRKNRGNAIFKQAANAEIDQTAVSTDIDLVKSTTPIESTEYSQLAEASEKLKNLEIINSDLLQQNEMLTNKIAAYIEEVSNLRDDSNKIDELLSSITTLSSQLVEKENEADQYLIRISELSFENAKLQTEVKQHQIASNTPQKLPPSINIPQFQSKNVRSYPSFMRHHTNNGYESWN